MGPFITWILQSREFSLAGDIRDAEEQKVLASKHEPELLLLSWGEEDNMTRNAIGLGAERGSLLTARRKWGPQPPNTRMCALFISRIPCPYFKGLQIRGQVGQHLVFGRMSPKAEESVMTTQTSDLQNWKKINLCCFKLLNVCKSLCHYRNLIKHITFFSKKLHTSETQWWLWMPCQLIV